MSSLRELMLRNINLMQQLQQQSQSIQKIDKDDVEDICQSDNKPENCISNAELNNQNSLQFVGSLYTKGVQRPSQILTHVLPKEPYQQLSEYQDRVYIGQFSQDGNLFYAATQTELFFYDTQNPLKWNLIKSIQGRQISWAISSVDLNPKNNLVAYSTLAETVQVLSIFDDKIHRPIHFSSNPLGFQQGFGIFSIQFSNDGKQLVAGTNNKCIMVNDIETDQVTLCVRNAHTDDINSVCFANKDNSNIIFTGSDDSIIKIWDQRSFSKRGEGALVGHREGVTCVSSKGDCIQLCSNGKDQTCKLWDIRKKLTLQQLDQRKKHKRCQEFDYRYMQYPFHNLRIRMKDDCSLMSFRGHHVLATLIRCYFSPQYSTNQRFIYSGSASGQVFIWDTVSGRTTEILNGHDRPIRDVSWHPYQQIIVSSSFDGTQSIWGPQTGQSRNRVKMDFFSQQQVSWVIQNESANSDNTSDNEEEDNSQRFVNFY